MFSFPPLGMLLTIMLIMFAGLGAKEIRENFVDYYWYTNLPACEYEDSRNCHWDASQYGNHTGRSFYDLNGEVHYVNFK